MNIDEISLSIAENIMNWKTGISNGHYFIELDNDNTWIWVEEFKPSERIEDAWKVIEKLKDEYEVIITTNGEFGYIVNINSYHEDITIYSYEKTFEKTISNACIELIEELRSY